MAGTRAGTAQGQGQTSRKITSPRGTLQQLAVSYRGFARKSPSWSYSPTTLVLHDRLFWALGVFPTQHCAHFGRRKDRQVRANFGAQLKSGKFLRKQTPHLCERCTAAMGKRTYRTLVSDSVFAGFNQWAHRNFTVKLTRTLAAGPVTGRRARTTLVHEMAHRRPYHAVGGVLFAWRHPRGVSLHL